MTGIRLYVMKWDNGTKNLSFTIYFVLIYYYLLNYKIISKFSIDNGIIRVKSSTVFC